MTIDDVRKQLLEGGSTECKVCGRIFEVERMYREMFNVDGVCNSCVSEARQSKQERVRYQLQRQSGNYIYGPVECRLTQTSPGRE